MAISDSSGEKSPRGSNEKVVGNPNSDVEVGPDTGLERTLSSRHLQFIAVGATIGTGLFLGTGSALSKAGPVSLLIAFVFMGSVVYSVMTSLGEMAAFIPVAGSFTAYATRFIDPTLGFSMGWLYWFSWSITFALELTAAGLIIQFWTPLSVGIWIAIFWTVFTALNYLPVRWFGEIEMWFSMIKVITIIGFIIFSICINAGVGQEGYIGFKYWQHPGPFQEYVVEGATGKFVGFWAVLVTAGFSYQGTELVGVGAGETANPRKAIPEAIRWTFWGIFGLFVSTIFFVGINIPANADGLDSGKTDASASPLVLIAVRAGVSVLPHILNAVLLTAVLSAANSNVYSSSRLLVALAEEGLAPAFMKKTNRLGTPYWSVACCSVLGLLSFLNLSSGGTVVFNWLLNISATSAFITWALISVCHLRFRKILKAQNVQLGELPYLAPMFPYLTWYGLFFNTLITLTSGFTAFIRWDTSDFFSAYVSLILFVVLYVVHKLVYRTKIVPVDQVDLSRGRVHEY
ncbi:amino acid permease/ SLC12A domain-containing protein [Mariannaea sp. PMI_226]|nr:amino acid permease/ SLC12A domain-containing protein [Mariannaea sp. PMI_226]